MTDINSGAPKIVQVLASAVALANNAGNIMKKILEDGKLGIIDKGTNDLQTEADRRIQVSVVQSLQDKFPQLTIIGEEDLPSESNSSNSVVREEDADVLALAEKCPQSYYTIEEKEIVVWVDPLDGTREFTTGLLDHVTVLIGIAVNGKPIAGVIHQPFYKNLIDGPAEGRTLWSLKDVGYGGFEPKPPPVNKLVVTVTRSHSDRQLESVLTKLKPDEILRVGGAGHKVLLLIDGRAHAYIVPSRGLKRWDTCAPEAILEAVGGLFTDIQGNHYSYDADTPHENNLGLIAVVDGKTQKICLDLFKE